MTRNPEFVAAVGPLVDTNGSTTLDSEFGTLLVDVQGVEQGTDQGALVVVTFQDQTYAGLHDTMRTYGIVAGLSLLLVVGFAAWQSGRLLAPLRTLRETADEITDTDLSRRLPVSGNDDITALTRTVNGMLDRLEEAFVGQRQFLDDAGHELKTPLTVLRGHLELLDVGNPEEIAETRELLLDEVDRMARLVGDLILLAKSDRPDFITRRPVDLTGLTVDVLAKARGLGDRRWTLDETASVTADVDEQRLTQALLQLCDNAVKHTARRRRDRPRLVVRRRHRAALGPGLRPGRAGRGPRARSSSASAAAPCPTRTRASGWASRSSGRSPSRTRGTVTVTDAEQGGAVFTLVIPIGAVPSPSRRPDASDDDTALDPQADDQTEEQPQWHGS